MNMYRDSSVQGLRKQDEKPKMDLMFPRLYINDNAEKKGPKAPPRNKMALYEHLATHNSNQSQNLQPNNNTSTVLVPSPFFNHNAYTNKQSFIPTLCDSSGSTTTTTHFNFNSTMETPLQHHQKDQRTNNVKTFQLRNCYNNSQISSSAEKKLDKNDDYRVQPNSSANGQEKTHKAKTVHCSYGEPITAFQQQQKQPTSTKLKLTHHEAQDNTKLFHPGHIQARGIIPEQAFPNPKKRSLVDYITRYVEPKIHLHQDYTGAKNNSLTKPKNAARKMNELEAIHGCSNEVKTGFRERKEERNHCAGLDISPDGVLGVMGQKQFLNTRSTLVYQQRVFALQVFELHRLIKVQRLIAGSPELILDGSFYPQNPSNPTIKTPNANVNEQPPPTPTIPKLKNDYEIIKLSSDCAAESVVTKIPLSLRNNAIKFEPNTEPSPSTAMDAKSDNKPSSGPTQLDEANLTPFCLHPPPGNQWLVPVSSPSEGLVYKPYTGACPPAGLMASICGPVPFTPAYAAFVSGTPLGPTYFAPYSFPLMNPFARSESNGADNQLSIREFNYTAPHQSSCNMLRHKSGESDLQGSTGSSTTERTRVDPLPLFPVEPAVQGSNEPPKSNSTDLNTLYMNHCTDEKQIQVIKVVPHNPKSASESAARIFQSIQEERRGYD